MQQILFESSDNYGNDYHGLRCQIHSLLAFTVERSPGVKIMRITQLRILTLILMCIGSLCIVISIATNQWHTITIKSSFTSKETEVSYGLFKNCTNGDCKTLETHEAWRTGVIACMFISIIADLFTFIGFAIIFLTDRSAKSISTGIMITAIFTAVALILYLAEVNISSKGSMGASYFVGWAGLVIVAGAGAFALATKEERIAPSFDHPWTEYPQPLTDVR